MMSSVFISRRRFKQKSAILAGGYGIIRPLHHERDSSLLDLLEAKRDLNRTKQNIGELRLHETVFFY